MGVLSEKNDEVLGVLLGHFVLLGGLFGIAAGVHFGDVLLFFVALYAATSGLLILVKTFIIYRWAELKLWLTVVLTKERK